MVQFGERMKLSSFVVSSLVNLTLKGLKITDTTYYTSPSGIRNLSARVRSEDLDNHIKTKKNLMCIKVTISK